MADQATITLTPAQVNYARSIARARQNTPGLQEAHGSTGGLDYHLLGAEGEMAFGAWLHGDAEFRLTVGTYRSRPDFPRTEVRTRSGGVRQDLIIRADDKPGHIYVLVLPGPSEHAWRLMGWLWGHETQGRRMATHGQREAAYFIERADLHGMSTYRAALDGRKPPPARETLAQQTGRRLCEAGLSGDPGLAHVRVWNAAAYRRRDEKAASR